MKYTTLVFVSAVLFSLSMSACNRSDVNTVADGVAQEAQKTDAKDTQEAETAPTTAQNAEESAVAAQPSDSSHHTLVVYYSASGVTRRVATTIAETLDADIFEIVPQKPYTDEDLDYRNQESRVTQEHDHPEMRDTPLVQVTPDHFADYQVVYIGYPIWWGIAAWPVDNFVKGNDFTGKTVIPFATAVSSPLADSGRNLAQLSGKGDWQEGIRFSSNVDAETVAEWAKSQPTAKK